MKRGGCRIFGVIRGKEDGRESILAMFTYDTAYRATMPETAKSTASGNSQVLALHLKRYL